jgi:hypothetical protein
MAKDKNSGIDKLKKEKGLKKLNSKEMADRKGGQKKSRWWSKKSSCGDITPQ